MLRMMQRFFWQTWNGRTRQLKYCRITAQIFMLRTMMRAFGANYEYPETVKVLLAYGATIAPEIRDGQKKEEIHKLSPY